MRVYVCVCVDVCEYVCLCVCVRVCVSVLGDSRLSGMRSMQHGDRRLSSYTRLPGWQTAHSGTSTQEVLFLTHTPPLPFGNSQFVHMTPVFH